MSAGPIDFVRQTARAFGPLLIAFAGLTAQRAEFGLAGAAGAGLAVGVVLALVPLIEGWRAARAALPIGLSLGLMGAGLAAMGLAWLAPTLAPSLAPEPYALQAAILAIDIADPVLGAGTALVCAGAVLTALSVFIARAADLSDEAL